jgi:very-short-patch-repair endonuclease
MSADQPAFRELLDRQCRVITRVQALLHLSRSAMEHRLASGRWQAVHHGVYLAHSGPIGPDERRWIAVLGAAGGHHAWLGGLTALETLGFQGFATEPIHVLIPARAYASRPPDGVIVHRTTLLPHTDLLPATLTRPGSRPTTPATHPDSHPATRPTHPDSHPATRPTHPDSHPATRPTRPGPRPAHRPPSTTAARALIDAAQWQPSPEQAAVIILAGFQQRMARTEEVTRVLANMTRVRHRSVIADAVRDAALDAASLPEAEFLRLCRSAGLPEPVMQQRRRTTAGRVNYLDAYFPAHRLHVEIDGAHHTNVRQWWADMQRQNDLWIPGDRVLRFPAWAIRHRPAEVAAQLRAALAIHPES